jgi:hypothetical protein
MDGKRFDRLTAAWGGRVGRRSALRGAAAAALAGLLAAPGLAPPEASAGPRRRCRDKHGVFLPSGTCHCATRCSTLQTDFPCHGNENCFCGETLTGKGFCAGIGLVNSNGCSLEVGNECPPGFTCLVNRGCYGKHTRECTTTDNCRAGDACVNGRCEQTSCVAECPT